MGLSQPQLGIMAGGIIGQPCLNNFPCLQEKIGDDN
jgi:hypothetical protein